MNSQIVKKESLIWIFCCLRATLPFMNSHFEKQNSKMGTVLQLIYSTEKESSQTNSFYVVLGIIITAAD